VVIQRLIDELVQLAGLDVLFKLPVPAFPLIVCKALQSRVGEGGDGRLGSIKRAAIK